MQRKNNFLKEINQILKYALDKNNLRKFYNVEG